jgi:uncharacterized protein (TIGR01777 family)
MKVVVTGSSGLIGTALTESLRADGHEVVRLVRRSPRAADEIRWDPQAVDAGVSGTALSGIEACVSLAGAPVGEHRWTRQYKAEIRSSRVIATRALAGVLAKLDPRPSAFVCGSAIGWYGNTSGEAVDESAPAAGGFLPGVVRDWEAACAPAADAGIRVVNLRSGLVMSPRGGVLGRLLPLARLGVCPRFGSGQQVWSWIALADEIAAIRFLLSNADCAGPYNLTAPAAVTNSELTSALERTLGRPDLRWLRVPAWALRLALGEMSSEVLGDSRVLPQRLTDAGFKFAHPEIGPALAAELEPRQSALSGARGRTSVGVGPSGRRA